MLLVTFTEGGRTRIGVLDRERAEIVDLTQGAALDMRAFIASGEAGLNAARHAVASGKGRVPLAQARLLAPIPRPARNVICAGKNYRDHVHEVRGTSLHSPGDKDGMPDAPIFFTKWTSSVIGPNDPIPASHDPTGSADYEGELAVVIGPGGRRIPAASAMRHVYGYTIINDVSSRTLQTQHKQWFLGKSLDGFCPMGPALLTADDVPDVGKLRLQTRVNGELRQDALVSGLIFDIATLIEALSLTLTLEPGDIIATGTPAGVGVGFTPPRYLNPGDRIAITVEPIGTLENPVS